MYMYFARNIRKISRVCVYHVITHSQRAVGWRCSRRAHVVKWRCHGRVRERER